MPGMQARRQKQNNATQDCNLFKGVRTYKLHWPLSVWEGHTCSYPVSTYRILIENPIQINLFGEESGQRRNSESQAQGRGKRKWKWKVLIWKGLFWRLRSEWGKAQRHDLGMTSWCCVHKRGKRNEWLRHDFVKSLYHPHEPKWSKTMWNIVKLQCGKKDWFWMILDDLERSWCWWWIGISILQNISLEDLAYHFAPGQGWPPQKNVKFGIFYLIFQMLVYFYSGEPFCIFWFEVWAIHFTATPVTILQ